MRAHSMDDRFAFASIDANTVTPDKQFILIGHSMGTSLAGRVALRYGPGRCKGVVAICPPSHVDPKMRSTRKSLAYIPEFVFNIFRAVDRSGGLTSHSVNRMVSPSVPPTHEIRTKQLRINLQVNTGPWMKTAYNFEPLTSREWGELNCPVFLIGSENDVVTPKNDVYDIFGWLNDKAKGGKNVIDPVILHDSGHAALIEKHHVLEGLISDFIIKHVNIKLSLGWQLAYLASKSDKWSLKNEAKWRKTLAVGEKIRGTRLRGMKTLRQNDLEHSPSILEKKYPDIYSIIDISREPPPYDPASFTRISYHKFPTVSKLPPTKKEVADFIEMVDTCMEEIKLRTQSADPPPDATLAVHCHYGFNRTGFFLCSYMVERLGYSINEAVEAFSISRPPGIKHPHFIDELYVRYEL
ncbi:hypothetical protein AWJ20_3317 [Sugiyamaella lignohabitans]|uniref:Tyrosine specific protein phosphatases domain-containing protein n=1 Tax=Sugiyamaella lignohabitans TaxID=796027 RepID=A0A167FTD9_9ASCO|nr:uncharacterized protein AWJ20_3317 [Sugiyamaella lignohabitans]ANB15679.1 hypothetical protein AWJ20_3317 [Sugiyamaella lignohabitans]